MFKIEWKENAIREISKLEKNIALKIYRKVDSLIADIKSSDVKRLKGQNMFRLRVGDYWVLFEIKGELITVLKVGHRKNIYDF